MDNINDDADADDQLTIFSVRDGPMVPDCNDICSSSRSINCLVWKRLINSSHGTDFTDIVIALKSSNVIFMELFSRRR